MLSSTVQVFATLTLIALLAYPVRGPLYSAIAGTTANSEVLSAAAALAAGAELLGLVGAAGAIAVWSWARDRQAFWRLVPAGVGVAGLHPLLSR